MPAKTMNNRRPCVPFASSVRRTRMPLPLPQALVVVGSQGQVGRRRVSGCVGATLSPVLLQPSPSSLPYVFVFRSPCMVPCCESIKRRTVANPFSSYLTPDSRLRTTIATLPEFPSPCTSHSMRDLSWKTHNSFYLFPILVLALLPLHTFLDFNSWLWSTGYVES